MNDACFFCTAPDCDICIENRVKCPVEGVDVFYEDGWYNVQPKKGKEKIHEQAQK